jgi:hypothetical protein
VRRVVVVAQRHVPESSDPEAARSVDVAGAVLGALGLAGITYALIALGEQGGSRLVGAHRWRRARAAAGLRAAGAPLAQPLLPPDISRPASSPPSTW